MLTIGIDLGTSAVKLLLMESDGKIHKIVSREYPLSFPRPGWSEQNPEDWLKETLAGIRELTADCDKSQVAGIGCGGQMHGLVVLDEDDRVIRPAILWNDGRTEEETGWLNSAVGKERLSALTANIAFAGFTAPKLLWMKKNEPELFARIRKIMLPKDYINYCLTGVHSCDYSDASGMLLLDVEKKCWSAEMLEICGVTEEQMPKLYESYEVTGTLRPEMAEALGLPATVKIVAGAGDNAAAAVGTGVVGEGGCNISLGTSGTIFISSDHFGVDPNNALHAFAHADGGYHLMGCMLSAASCNKWFCEDILGTDDYAEEQKEITDEKLGRNHVFFLPYLMGEVADQRCKRPRYLHRAEHGFDTRRHDAGGAGGRGLCHPRFSGGGALARPRPEEEPHLRRRRQKPALAEDHGQCLRPGAGADRIGGAILAAVGCGAYPSVQEAAEKLVHVTATVKPDPEIRARYEERYQKHCLLYPALRAVFPLL